jgi:DNA-binding MarR family transcriptional regulator
MQLNATTTALVLVKPQSMGGTLAAMEEEGLVERQPHPTDGRQILYGNL